MTGHAFGLLGGGSQADETAEFDPSRRVIFRAVSADRVHETEGSIDIGTDDDQLLATPVAVAVGAPGLKRRLVEAWGGTLQLLESPSGGLQVRIDLPERTSI